MGRGETTRLLQHLIARSRTPAGKVWGCSSKSCSGIRSSQSSIGHVPVSTDYPILYTRFPHRDERVTNGDFSYFVNDPLEVHSSRVMKSRVMGLTPVSSERAAERVVNAILGNPLTIGYRCVRHALRHRRASSMPCERVGDAPSVNCVRDPLWHARTPRVIRNRPLSSVLQMTTDH